MTPNARESAPSPRQGAGLAAQATWCAERIAQPWLVQLLLRLAVAVPFLSSGLLKWDGFLQISDTAVYLFTDEFRLHLPGGPYRYPAPALFAFLSACGEVLFAALLIAGLGSRFAALGLAAMTIVIQLTVPDGWTVHLTWLAMALGVAAWGPGRISIDHLLGDRKPRSGAVAPR